jgi:glycosyltransferase involved in cell wall biosynthesis
MNILFMSELFYPNGGGGELATWLYADLLASSGFNVVVVSDRFPGDPQISRKENFKIHRIPLSSTRLGKYSVLRPDIMCSTFMRKILHWCDVVYIPRFWYSAIPAARNRRKIVLVHLHGYYPVCPVATLYDLSENRICHHRYCTCSLRCIANHERSLRTSYKQILASVALNSTLGCHIGKLASLSDSIICVSNAQKELLIKHMPCIANRLTTIYNPMPHLDEFMGQSGDFGYFGGPSLLKGHTILRNAIHNLNPPIKMHMTNMLRTSRISSGVIQYPRLSREDYGGVYKTIQVVVVPSIWPEPLPYVVSEAVASGRVVIASRIGGIPEQTEGMKGTFLFEPGDIEQLTSMMAYVRDLSKEDRMQLGQANKEAFAARFDNHRSTQDFIAVLEKTRKAR